MTDTSLTNKNIAEAIHARSENEKEFKQNILLEITNVINVTGLEQKDKNHLKLSITELLEKGVAAYSQDVCDADEDMIHELILHREEPFIRELEKYKAALTKKEYSVILMQADRYVLADLDWTDLYSYCTKLFPLASKLKRRLLLLRPGTDQTNIRYILEHFNIEMGTRRVLENAEKTGNYTLITNDACASAVSLLVKEATGAKQFRNTIAPLLDYKRSEAKAHNPEAETVFRLAYGFRLSAEDFDSFANSSMSVCWNPFDMEQAILRFGLHTGISFQQAEKLLETYKINYKPATITRTHTEAEAEIRSFFTEHPTEYIAPKPCDQPLDETLTTDYMQLIALLGVTDSQTAKSILAQERLAAAQREISEIKALLDPVTVAAIKKAYEDAEMALKRNHDQLVVDMERILDIFMVHEKNSFDKLEYETDAEKIIQYLIDEINRFYSADTSFRTNKLTSENKSSLMTFLTDQKRAITRGSTMNEPITTNRINKIMYGEAVKVDRALMIRFAYLRALIAKLTGQTDASGSVQMFQEKATMLMQECAYPAPNYLFPQDISIFISLSDTSVFSPMIYQMFFMRKK